MVVKNDVPRFTHPSSSSSFYIHIPSRPHMTATRFHASMPSFCRNSLHLHQNRKRRGSSRQSIISKACITASWQIIEANILHRIYILLELYLWSPYHACGFHGTRRVYCKARHHWATHICSHATKPVISKQPKLIQITISNFK